MNLNTKFALITVFSAVQMVVLTVSTILGSNLLQAMKHYQYIQVDVQYELSESINFLKTADSWPVDTETIYTKWSEKLNSLDSMFLLLKTDGVYRHFPNTLRSQIDEAENQWDALHDRLQLFNIRFETIQNTAVSENIRQQIKKSGIRSVAVENPQIKEIGTMIEQLDVINSEMGTIAESEQRLDNVMNEMFNGLIKITDRAHSIFTMAASVLCVLSAIILFIITLGRTTAITRRIKQIKNMSSNLAQKDFTVSVIPSGSTEMHELMANMNKMVSELNDFFVIVKKNASKAISSGYSINDSANSTAAATVQINANIESITKEFEIINESVDRAALAIQDMDGQVSTLVKDNEYQTQAIEDSNNAVSGMAKTIEQISKSAAERTKNAEEMRDLVADGDDKITSTNALLEQITSQLGEISDIITLINSIAEQTNLLSMNAAIESAHAGEAGKGFAVVAEEIRTLAESTSDNSKKISDSISKIVDKVKTANASSNDASAAFEKVSRHSEVMLDSFKEITAGVTTIDDQTQRITAKTDETAAAADKINGYCGNLAKQQETVSKEMRAIYEVFSQAMAGIKEISKGTEDIVKRMTAVGEQSTESYKNMAELENVLEKFKTKEIVEEQVEAETADLKIENIISPELQAEINGTGVVVPHKDDEIDFDPSMVEEYNSTGAEK